MDKKITLLLAALLIMEPSLSLSREPTTPAWQKGQETPRAGGPKGMAIYEQARQANEDMEPVVVEESPVVPPGEDPPSDLPTDNETVGQATETRKEAPAGKR